MAVPAQSSSARPVAAQPADAPDPVYSIHNTDYSVRLTPPQGFIADADLAEWAPLIAAGDPSHSHIAVSLNRAGLVLAGELSGSYANGIWISVSSDPLELPPLAFPQLGGGINPTNCESTYDQSFPAALRVPCKALLAQHTTLTAKYLAGFAKLYRINAQGVGRLENGKLLGINGAVHSFALRDGKCLFEVVIPPLALPRFSESPISSFQIASSDAPASSPPSVLGEDKLSLQLPLPLQFEPFGDMRSIVVTAAPQLNPWTAPRVSYQPGDALNVEVVSYYTDKRTGILALKSESQPLFTDGPRLGKIQLVHTMAAMKGMILLEDDKPRIFVSGPTEKIVERGGCLHMIGVEESSVGPYGPTAVWRVVNVCSVDSYDYSQLPYPDTSVEWRSVQSFHNSDYSEFGVRGLGRKQDDNSGRPIPVEFRWMWDAVTSSYVLIKPKGWQ